MDACSVKSKWDLDGRNLRMTDVDIFPSYSVFSGEGVVSRDRLDSVEGLVIWVVESVKAFVFLHRVNERSASLSIVGRVAVQA